MSSPSDRTPVPIPDRRLEKAKKGVWPALGAVLKQAVQDLEQGRPLPDGYREHLAAILGRLEAPGLRRVFSTSMEALEAGGPVPEPAASDLAEFLSPIAQELLDATERKARYLEEHPPRDGGGALAPVPRRSDFLRLDAQTQAALGLRDPEAKGGRPPGELPTDRFFDLYDLLLGYGLAPSHAQTLLGLRFAVDVRTVQRKLRKKQRRQLSEEQQPFEPYLKARLTVTWRRTQRAGLSPQAGFAAVARAFGLSFVGPGASFDGGAPVVESAVGLCEEEKDGWAKIPLAVAEEEADRLPPQMSSKQSMEELAATEPVNEAEEQEQPGWPTPAQIAELRAFAVRTGESLSTITSASRPLADDFPRNAAVESVASSLGISWEWVMDSCRQRLDYSALMGSLTSQGDGSTS